MAEKYKPLGRNKKPLTMEGPEGKIEVPAGAARLEITPENMEKARRSREQGTDEDVEIKITLDPKNKRQPIMADRWLAAPVSGMLISKKNEENLRDHLRECKRFVLDNDGARYMGQIIRENPKMIAKNIEFAIPPFPKMYVEVPFLTLYREITGREPDDRADSTWAVMLRGPHAFIITEGVRGGPPMIMPWYYWLNKPWDLKDELRAAEKMRISRAQIDRFFWGEAFDKLDAEEQRTLRAYHSMWLLNDEFLSSEVADKILTNIYDTSAGDLRNIVATILLLNRSGDYSYEEQFGPHRAMYRAKPRTFLAHSVVKFRMDPVKRVIGTRGVGGAWRREHDVKGHFCHDKRARAAQMPGGTCARDAFGEPKHHWREYGVNQWRCLICDGLRWWRKDCRRGTRDKGKVKTSYEVTARS